MRIDILSAVPDQLTSPLTTSMLKRAQDKGVVEIHVHNLRDFTDDKHKTLDDTMFGGGAGMVMMIQPIARAIRHLQSERKYDEVIFLTPDGKVLNQSMANQLSMNQNLILLAGHYKGIDQRVRDMFITKEISIGDYVLTGGELPALVLTDAIVRLLPGVLNDESSALFDSFQDGLLEPPVYTRPAVFEGHEVPPVLLSGNFAHIEKWRDEMALKKTQAQRPDLLKDSE